MRDEVLTERLRVRDFTDDDLPRLVELFDDELFWRFPYGRGLTAGETASWLERKLAAQAAGVASPSAAEGRAGGRLLGYIALTPPDWLPEVMPSVEIGWRLEPAAWGQGLATEGAAALLGYGFETMGLSEILSIYEPDNVASGRVMGRLGIAFDHATRHPFFDRPLHVHRLTRKAWEARAGA